MANNYRFVLLVIFSLVYIFGLAECLVPITTDDCNISNGCFRYPDNCQNESCVILFKWSDSVDSINFLISARLNGQVSTDSSWVAIGFSRDQNMGDDNACICKHAPGLAGIEQYYTQSHVTPQLLTQIEPQIGIHDSKIEVDNGFLTCSFKRIKTIENQPNYFDLNSNWYILAAVGPLLQGGLEQHTLKMASSGAVNFTTSNFTSITVTKLEKSTKPKAHGCLMVIAWVFLVPTAILVARYYRNLFPGMQFLGVEIWFGIHFLSMVLAVLFVFIALLIILSDLNWTWALKSEKLHFAHSVFGILAIVLAFVQIALGVFRCDKENDYRFIFNYVHRTLGLTVYSFALIAMFMGLSMDDMNMGSNGYGILIGWLLWLIVIITSIEISEYLANHQQSANITDSSTVTVTNNNLYPFGMQEIKPNVQEDTSHVQTIRTVLIILHVVSAFAFMLALIVTIGSA